MSISIRNAVIQLCIVKLTDKHDIIETHIQIVSTELK